MKDKQAYWIGGTVTAALGVALVRLLSPELPGIAGPLTMATGYVLVAAGITLISCATRRRRSEAFIVVDRDAKDRKRP